MYIYDTQKKDKVLFEPIRENEVRIYVCGPTVYDDAHLGHARSAIAFDLLRRSLIALGYKVVFVKNFTDIDDKIINKMKQTNQTLEQITSFYINRYKTEMNALHVKDADIEPKATDSLEYIQESIQVLLDKNFAYKIDDGIYFDTSKDEKYLCLSHQNLDDSRARITQKDQKKDQKDFALWKKVKDNEVGFESPFGRGRPGWHIECSAMISHFLAYDGEFQIDIHCGGADLLFPHHENEAAQTRHISDQNLAKYWLHNGFVTINGEKMSKSLGNSFFLKDALKNYEGEVLRFYLLCTHYRADFNFSEYDLVVSKKRLDKLYRLKKRISSQKKSNINIDFKNNFLEAISDDLNISKALSVVDEMVNKANEFLDKEPKNKNFIYELNANLDLIKDVLGIGYMDTFEYFQQGFSKDDKEKIQHLIDLRNEAKSLKEYEKADKIRNDLKLLHVNIMDTPNGTVWERNEQI